MKIIAHRGKWTEDFMKNSPDALRKALESGFGIESDIRDYCGKMVISHNIADSNCQEAEEVFKWLNEYKDRMCFAINIKADGLKELLLYYLEKYNISNYFLFDMSIPQMVEFKEVGLKFFTRQSEIESSPCLYEDASGIWIDGFWRTDWITESLLKEHIDNGKKICIVSPELHNRTYIEFWGKLRLWQLDKSNIMLCTDHPDEAKEFFYEK